MLVRSFRAVVSCACLFITLIGVSSAQKEKVLAPHRPIAPRLPDNPPKTGPLRSMVGVAMGSSMCNRHQCRCSAQCHIHERTKAS